MHITCSKKTCTVLRNTSISELILHSSKKKRKKKINENLTYRCYIFFFFFFTLNGKQEVKWHTVERAENILLFGERLVCFFPFTHTCTCDQTSLFVSEIKLSPDVNLPLSLYLSLSLSLWFLLSKYTRSNSLAHCVTTWHRGHLQNKLKCVILNYLHFQYKWYTHKQTECLQWIIRSKNHLFHFMTVNGNASW